jgi:parallel beta-helix repeat protein
MLTLAFNIQPVRAEPKTWHVDDDRPTDFSKIQDAINAANDGDTIFVHNGTYYENVAVNKTLSLVGENRYSTVIDGRDSGDAITITADNSSVSDFEVRNSGDSKAGIYFEYCCNVTVSQNLVENTSIGIFGWISGDSNRISENLVRNNSVGIWIVSAGARDTINGNIVANNSEGIDLHYAYNSSITGNTVVDNTGSGIYFDGDYNRIWRNIITNNGIGIGLQSAFNNIIWHNNFDNEVQISRKWDTSASSNAWDDGYPSGGNYWSDYDGTDLYRGPYQNVTGSDGIGDTSYVIDANNNTDHYPLMKPYALSIGDVNKDGKVDMIDIGIVALSFGSSPGDLRWNPLADVNQDGKVDLRDIGLVARHFGEHYS